MTSTLSCHFSPELWSGLKGHIQQETGPHVVWTITQAGLRVVAKAHATSIRSAMLWCLERALWPLRFVRNAGVFSAQDQAILLANRVAIVGCGALGGHCAMLLARLGVGGLVLCDPDSFDETNLNRQIFCTEDVLGRNKAQVTQEKLMQVASHLDIHVFPVAAATSTLPDILHAADIVVDCLDSLEARVLVEAQALTMGIPFIHGALAGFEGFAAVSLPGEASLLSRLYSNPATTGNSAGREANAEKLAGLPAPTPAVIASLEVCLATRVLLAKKDATLVNFSHRLIHVDLSVPELELLSF